MQHLNRLRRELIAEGHLVPPVPSRPAAGESSDLEIRGYVRDDANGNDRETTRPVRFDEPMDDRKFSLPDSFVEDGDETGRVTPIRDGSEDEGNAELDSPTPLGRSYRHMSSARPTAKTEPNGSSLYPVPPGTSAVDHGTTPLDEVRQERA